MGNSWFIMGSHTVFCNSEYKSIWKNENIVIKSQSGEVRSKLQEEILDKQSAKLPNSSLMSVPLGHTG